jgi:hypothetical protein
LLNSTFASYSNSFDFISDLISVNISSVLLDFESIDVVAAKRQKKALAKLHRIGKSILIFLMLKIIGILSKFYVMLSFIFFEERQ